MFAVSLHSTGWNEMVRTLREARAVAMQVAANHPMHDVRILGQKRDGTEYESSVWYGFAPNGRQFTTRKFHWTVYSG